MYGVRSHTCRDGGLTTIELLVVVLVVGILAAIAIPIYIGVKDGAHSQHATVATVPAPAPDIHADWIQVFDGNGHLSKRCDGKTLLYQYDGSLAAVPNSPECT